MPAPILAGAEPWSAPGGPAGALVLHGFTGNPQSMRGLAEALAEAGFAIEMPLLPGHGTVVEELAETGFEDWLGAAESAYRDLVARCEKVVVVGLSMGGALTAWLASDHPVIAGIVCINPVVQAPEGMQDLVQGMIDAGQEYMDGIGADIADPESTEAAYAQTPLHSLVTMFAAVGEFRERLKRITSPLLIITSPQDHVVDPANSDVLAEAVQGPVTRLRCERSYHVATLDYDRAEIEAATVEFCRKVTA